MPTICGMRGVGAGGAGGVGVGIGVGGAGGGGGGVAAVQESVTDVAVQVIEVGAGVVTMY